MTMRGKVRAVEPPLDDGSLEEIVAEAPADVPPAPDGSGRGAGPAGGSPATGMAFHLVSHDRPIGPADLGPNGDVVFDLLARAARLAAPERRALEKDAGWRWWMMTPLAGSTMPAARARALVLGRAAGRADAIVALEAVVADVVHAIVGPRAGRSLLPACISNAGLAVLVRDLVEPEVFETLFGPWREVMHH
jgi:hypothetical protein